MVSPLFAAGVSSNLMQANTLVVAPNNLIGQWREEVRKFAKDGAAPRVLVFHQPSKRPRTPAELCEYDIVITTPALAIKEIKGYNRVRGNFFGLLNAVQWHRVILDEAHMVRRLLSQPSHDLASPLVPCPASRYHTCARA